MVGIDHTDFFDFLASRIAEAMGDNLEFFGQLAVAKNLQNVVSSLE